MPDMTAPVTKVSFFGATGDCAGFCLAETLKAGVNCAALARSATKLNKSLRDKGVSSESLERHLTIVEGDVKDPTAVGKTLQVQGEVADLVVSGIGGRPVPQWSVLQPLVLPDPTLCQDAGQTILKALVELRPSKKPVLVNISTTGISSREVPRDVPLAFTVLYHWLLSSPHKDKMVLERVLREHSQLPVSQRGIEAYINVKPSLLMDGEGLGVDAIRQGTATEPAVGYTIRRQDVGNWIYERCIKTAIEPGWHNSDVTITY